MAGIHCLNIKSCLNLEIVFQAFNEVPVYVEPPEVEGNEGVIEPNQMVIGQVEPLQTRECVKYAVDVGEEVGVQADRLQLCVVFKRASFDLRDFIFCKVKYLETCELPKLAPSEVAYIILFYSS